MVYADADNGADGGACGTLAFPCQSIAEALTKIDDQGRDWIKLADGNYRGSLTLDGVIGKIVLLRGLIIGPAHGERNAAHGVRCVRVDEAPAFRLHRVLVRGNDGVGVEANQCDVTIEQSELFGNEGGGISVGQSTFSITNNFIFSNGSGASNFGGVDINVGGATGVFDFNTVTNNSSPSSQGAGIRCRDPPAKFRGQVNQNASPTPMSGPTPSAGTLLPK